MSDWRQKSIMLNTTTTILWPFVQDYRVSRYQKKHSPTHHPDHHPIFISFFHLPRSIASSLFKWYVLDNLFAQPLSMSSLVYLLVWSPPPHIPYISSPNQCLLFATHAYIIATCFAVVSILYHLFLAFLSTPYLDVTLTLHIRPFSSLLAEVPPHFFLTGQVSLPCSIIIMSGYNHNIKAWISKKCHIVSTLLSTLQQKLFP